MKYCPEQGTGTETLTVQLPFLVRHSNCGVKLKGRALCFVVIVVQHKKKILILPVLAPTPSFFSRIRDIWSISGAKVVVTQLITSVMSKHPVALFVQCKNILVTFLGGKEIIPLASSRVSFRVLVFINHSESYCFVEF